MCSPSASPSLYLNANGTTKTDHRYISGELRMQGTVYCPTAVGVENVLTGYYVTYGGACISGDYRKKFKHPDFKTQLQ